MKSILQDRFNENIFYLVQDSLFSRLNTDFKNLKGKKCITGGSGTQVFHGTIVDVEQYAIIVRYDNENYDCSISYHKVYLEWEQVDKNHPIVKEEREIQNKMHLKFCEEEIKRLSVLKKQLELESKEFVPMGV